MYIIIHKGLALTIYDQFWERSGKGIRPSAHIFNLIMIYKRKIACRQFINLIIFVNTLTFGIDYNRMHSFISGAPGAALQNSYTKFSHGFSMRSLNSINK